MTARRLWLICFAMVLAVPACAADSARPRLLLSSEEVIAIKAADALPGSFEQSIRQARARVDQYLDELPDVPVPKDPGGGYTHEQHKRNQVTIYEAGLLYQVTGEAHYAHLARDLLNVYADLYPSLGDHPAKRNQSAGRLFWQSLNEAVWLVFAIQGYDAIYEALSDSERSHIEKGLLLPITTFMSVESPQTFDRIHNHGTWAVAAVGMTGYVLGNQEMVEQSLLGLKKDGEAGFLKQLDQLFSPDGYYTEGPYYQRYALMPFVLFAEAIARNEPHRQIFEHRDGVLMKAIYTTVQLSYNGLFFPINDAMKDKGLGTQELIYAMPIAFARTGDTGLLSIAKLHDRIMLSGDGFKLAQALDAGRATPFEFKSIQLGDGSGGDEGALSILRSGHGPGHQALVFKSTAQGLGHGHFDRLSWLFYDNGNEIISDYGAARFLNVEEKEGGRYLPENTSWAKQTVAHNTLVVDQASHFGGDWKLSQKNGSRPVFFEAGPDVQIASAQVTGIYNGVDLNRTMLMINSAHFQHPLVLDVLKAESAQNHLYDLPLYFQGHITHVNREPDPGPMSPLGQDNGYQHLWLRAKAPIDSENLFRLTWLNDDRFYTYTAIPPGKGEALFTELGANDPSFNLRREQGLMLRIPGASNPTFVSLLELHGEYNGTKEFTTESASTVQQMERLSVDGLDVIRIETRMGGELQIALSYDPDPAHIHRIPVGDETLEWSGFYQVFNEGG